MVVAAGALTTHGILTPQGEEDIPVGSEEDLAGQAAALVEPEEEAVVTNLPGGILTHRVQEVLEEMEVMIPQLTVKTKIL